MEASVGTTDWISELIDGLEGLASDRGALARLKRCAGRSLAECTDVYGLFYRILPARARGVPWLEESSFLMASLFPFAPGRGRGDLGQALHVITVREPRSAGGIDRRMGILLDAGQDELPFRLRQAVQLLASKEIGIDWRRLTRDVVDWQRPGRDAQKRWARSYYGAATDTEQAAATTAVGGK